MMQSFFDWFRAEPANLEKPWLVLGKGPSFSKLHTFTISDYHGFALNHVVRELPARVAHIIDLDVVESVADALLANAQVVVMPWIPHVRNNPGAQTLEAHAQTNATLRTLASQGRLLWYNASTAKERARAGSPVVGVRYFSAEAALGLLAQAGVTRIRSLGIDGGTTYSDRFLDLSKKTLLANGRDSFQSQFPAIAELLFETKVDYAPLDVESPIRVYVGATLAQRLPALVLSHSIRRRASMSVEVRFLDDLVESARMPLPRRQENRPRTPFSFQRFFIPELAGFRGRAIYLDSDMQVFADVRELWTSPMLEHEQLLAMRRQAAGGPPAHFAVMLIDCERARWRPSDIVAKLDSGELTYEALMQRLAIVPEGQLGLSLNPAWNHLDHYEEGKTQLLHYTNMLEQPWLCAEHPLNHLWTRELFQAIEHGDVSQDLVDEHVQRGFVRPSLSFQVRHRIEDSFALPLSARLKDWRFAFPFDPTPQWRRWRRNKRAFLARNLKGYVRAVMRQVSPSALPNRRRDPRPV